MGLEDIVAYAQRKQEEARLNQGNLFGGAGGGGVLQEPKLKPVPKWSSIERLNKERELIGFYLSGHPLNRYKEDIRLFGKQNLSDEFINQLQHDSELRFIAIITSKRQAVDRKGRPIAFLMVEDLHSSLEVAVFSKEFDKFAPLIEVDNVVYITGKYAKRERGNSLIVNNMERIENLREKFQDKLRLKLNIQTEQITSNDLTQMETLFELNKGNTMVKLNVFSKEANAPIKMNLRNFVVEPSDELLSGLREVLGEESVELFLTG